MSEIHNVDKQETDKFSALADRWWDVNGDMKSLHDVNPLRHQFITDQVSLAGKTALDIGCAGGILTESLAKSGATATGIDLAEKTINAAKHHARENGLNIDYRFQSAESLLETHPQHFDVITCMEVLEHVPDPQVTLKTCADLLKPGGSLFVSTINRTVKAYFSAIIAAEYILRLLPIGTHQYSKLIKPSEMKGWCAKQHMDFQRYTGITYNPLTKKFKLDPKANINYIMHFIKR